MCDYLVILSSRHLVLNKEGKSDMNNRRFIPVLILLALGIGGWTYYRQLPATAAPAVFTASGTIEATEIHLGALQGGRVTDISVKEGDKVQAGQVLAVVYAATAATGPAVKDLVRS